MRKIIALDVGLNHLGVALVEEEKVIHTYLIAPKASWGLSDKLGYIYREVRSLTDSFFSTPEESRYLLFENPVFSFNSSTGKKLDYVVGVLYLIASQYSCSVESYAVKEIKKELGIKQGKLKKTRENNKSEVKDKILQLVDYNLETLSDHEVDAIAVSQCYLLRNKIKA